eukprot:TRINITY_DN1752_c0_g1_i1.p1 TRINITY_DN1752_c0_g1~~TRINITY_DN1752_c0_g1_i1.p1  ORF type:complete len:356 (+),score=87.70 TRINITY_DN1752_c0_g1_i1:83-1150(+)
MENPSNGHPRDLLDLRTLTSVYDRYPALQDPTLQPVIPPDKTNVPGFQNSIQNHQDKKWNTFLDVFKIQAPSTNEIPFDGKKISYKDPPDFTTFASRYSDVIGSNVIPQIISDGNENEKRLRDENNVDEENSGDMEDEYNKTINSRLQKKRKVTPTRKKSERLQSKEENHDTFPIEDHDEEYIPISKRTSTKRKAEEMKTKYNEPDPADKITFVNSEDYLIKNTQKSFNSYIDVENQPYIFARTKKHYFYEDDEIFEEKLSNWSYKRIKRTILPPIDPNDPEQFRNAWANLVHNELPKVHRQMTNAHLNSVLNAKKMVFMCQKEIKKQILKTMKIGREHNIRAKKLLKELSLIHI